jgi:AraC family transcriptional regulator, L-rhamnose operon transcriptional activator RhaR
VIEDPPVSRRVTAYDAELAQRIRERMTAVPDVSEKKMFGGLAFLTSGNMTIGVYGDGLIARIAPEAMDAALAEPGVRPFDIGGRPMSGWVLVSGEDLSADDELERWVDRSQRHPPVESNQGLFHFTEPMPAYAGSYLHEFDSPVHTHSFVEIAFAIGGSATHHSVAGRHEMRPGDVVLLRPGVWHGYEDCREFEVYNCCFSSELLRRELSWTREDPLLGYLLWAGPYSSPGRGALTISLGPTAIGQCLVHLDALAALRHRPLALHRADIVGRLSLLFGQLGQAVTQARGVSGAPGSAHPAVVQAMRLLEADIARSWTLTGLAAELHLAPGYLVRLFNAATGLPPMAYLAQLRAEHAALLLLHSDEPVTSIGRAVGWPDQSGFARRFKAHHGLSATTYRKRFATRATHLHLPATAAS